MASTTPQLILPLLFFASLRTVHARRMDLRKQNLKRASDTPTPAPNGPLLRQYKSIAAVAAPVATYCPWWVKNGIHTGFYNSYSFLCGIEGEGKDALDEHIVRVWNLIVEAYDYADGGTYTSDVLRVFTAPEWTFRRYPPRSQSKEVQYVKPLSGAEANYIIEQLQVRLENSISRDFTHWLILPGSIYWGVPLEGRLCMGGAGKIKWDESQNRSCPEYAIFNTLPVFYRSRILTRHNKIIDADFLTKDKEVWGFTFVKAFSPLPQSCSSVESGSSIICGAEAFIQFVQTWNKPEAENLQLYGLKRPETALVVNGLLVGIDICADHRNAIGQIRAVDRLSYNQPNSEFDIQILISSGMTFSVPEQDNKLALHLRAGGVAIAADGVYGAFAEASRLLVKQRAILPIALVNGRPSKSFLGFFEIPLSLSTDYTAINPVVANSWYANRDGNHEAKEKICQATANSPLCKLCSTKSHREVLRELFASNKMKYGDENKLETLCLSEPGNWRLFKIWGGRYEGGPLPLPAPQEKTVKELGDSKGISLLAGVYASKATKANL